MKKYIIIFAISFFFIQCGEKKETKYSIGSSSSIRIDNDNENKTSTKSHLFVYAIGGKIIDKPEWVTKRRYFFSIKLDNGGLFQA